MRVPLAVRLLMWVPWIIAGVLLYVWLGLWAMIGCFAFTLGAKFVVDRLIVRTKGRK